MVFIDWYTFWNSDPYTLLKVVSYYDLSALSMSVMGFKQKTVWVGRWVELYPSLFWNLLNFAKRLTSNSCFDHISQAKQYRGDRGYSCYRGRLLRSRFMKNYHIHGDITDNISIIPLIFFNASSQRFF